MSPDNGKVKVPPIVVSLQIVAFQGVQVVRIVAVVDASNFLFPSCPIVCQLPTFKTTTPPPPPRCKQNGERKKKECLFFIGDGVMYIVA
jgi:hypothetical protein